MADDRRQKGDRVFSAAACEVSTILPQLLEIAHCLVSSFEVHIRMGCICFHRYASTTGVIWALTVTDSRFEMKQAVRSVGVLTVRNTVLNLDSSPSAWVFKTSKT